MLINFSNHKGGLWSHAQLDAASVFGAVEDIPFPAVDANADEAEIDRLAVDYVREIQQRQPSAVLCQGEFGLTYALVSRLLREGIRVIYACSERYVEEHVDSTGRTVKEIRFEFVRFRDYQ